MSKANQFKLCFLMVSLLVFTLSPWATSRVEAQVTIPSRTPTPAATSTQPPPPTAENPTSTPRPPQPTNPVPTNTAQPTESATGTSAPTLPPPSPAGDVYATADPCSLEPTVQVFGGPANARSGPGQDYEIVGQVAYLEVRPIIGRSASTPWWQITLTEDAVGWVADEFVIVSGYTGAIPLIPSPALPSGETPTPGAKWDPTPNPICTPPPNATVVTGAADGAASATTPTVTEAPPTSTEVIPAAEPTRLEESVALGGNAQNAQTEATTTAVSPPTKVPALVIKPAIPTAAPLEADLVGSSMGSPGTWLPMFGAGLLMAGVILFFVRRR